MREKLTKAAAMVSAAGRMMQEIAHDWAAANDHPEVRDNDIDVLDIEVDFENVEVGSKSIDFETASAIMNHVERVNQLLEICSGSNISQENPYFHSASAQVRIGLMGLKNLVFAKSQWPIKDSA